MSEPETPPEPEVVPEPPPEEPTDEEIDAEEESTDPAEPVELDQEGLLREAKRRVDRIEARGKDPSKTYAGFVVALFDEDAAAADAALRAEAQKRLDGPLAGSSETYRKHSLAGKVTAGEFDS
jgi:hypothetical protein